MHNSLYQRIFVTLTEAHHFTGKNSILSGPAAGVIGAIKTTSAIGLTKIISFDMGGTSTDVAHYCGELERTSESIVSGFRLRAPMIKINTIAAGGGSVLHFRQNRYQVGPDSAHKHVAGLPRQNNKAHIV